MSQVENHGLWTDHLLAHQARDVCHRIVSPTATTRIHAAAPKPATHAACRKDTAAATDRVSAPSASGIGAATARRISTPVTPHGCHANGLRSHGAAGPRNVDGGLRLVARDPVVVSEDTLMIDSVVGEKGRAHFCLVGAALHRALEGRNLGIIFAHKIK